MKSFLVKKLFQNKSYFNNTSVFGLSARDTEFFNTLNFQRSIKDDVGKIELEIINKIFKKYNIKLFLTHGSCLGAIREGNFIQNDSDIDIGCYKNDIKKIVLAVRELSYKFGFRIIKVSLDDESITIIKNTVEIEITLYQKDTLHWKANRHKIFTIPHKFLDNLNEIDFLGIKINVPCCVEEYLEYQYGKDWRTPIKDFYSPYRQKIELPIFNFLKYIIGKKLATKFAKFISNIAKKIRQNYA